MTEPACVEPTDEDVAAIVAVLLAQRAESPAADPPVSGWVQVARLERVDRWGQPTRLSRLAMESTKE